MKTFIKKSSAIILFICGVTFVFIFSRSYLAQTETKLTASDGEARDKFGYTICLEGDKLVVGSVEDDDNGYDAGSVYILEYDGTDWVENAKVFPLDPQSVDWFGFSVSISGNRILIGAPGVDDSISGGGAAYIFEFDGSEWRQSAKLIPDDSGMDDWFGWTVSIWGDRALVGTYRNDENGSESGAAYVYKWDGNDWVLDTKLLASDGNADDYFGYSLSLRSDRAIVGAYGADNGLGAAYVFQHNGTDWDESAKLTASTGGGAFGISVSLFEDQIIVGSSSSLSAFIFDFNGTSWDESAILTPSDPVGGDVFGYSVSLADQRALVGAYRKDSQTGAAYLYDYDGTSWNQTTKLIASDAETGDRYSFAVDIEGSKIMVGSPHDDNANGDLAGAVYYYETQVDCGLTPESAVNQIYTEHTVTATVTRDGLPVEGVNVDFEILSGPNTGETGSSSTNASGEAAFTYTGDGGTGTDLIEASGVLSTVDFSSTAENTWFDVQCALFPLTAANPINTQHTITATVTQNGVPVEGIAVNFYILSGPNTGETTSDNTNSSGQASFTYFGVGGGGTDVIEASGIVNTIPFNNQAEITWEELVCTLEPETINKAVSTSHTVTATLLVNGNPVSGQTLEFEVFSGPNIGQFSTENTDLNGQAEFTYTSNGSIGLDVVRVSGIYNGASGNVYFDAAADVYWDNFSDWTADLEVTNIEGLQILSFGQYDNATDGIDAGLGEIELPPVPPDQGFDARFQLPGGATESRIDYRPFGEDNLSWTLKIQSDPETYPVVITWNPAALNDGKYFLKDPFGGTLLNINMNVTSVCTLSAAGLNTLIIEYIWKVENSFEVAENWNLISVPSQSEDMSKTTLFPSAASSAYWFDGAYVVETELECGKGYWLKFDNPETITIVGKAVSQAVSVNQGWNLIGPFEETVPLTELVTDPAGILMSNFFGFSNSYFPETESLKSGKGYWIRCSQNGEIIFYPNVLLRGYPISGLSTLSNDWGKLVVNDAAGRLAVLYIGKDAKTDDLFSLPPLPPNGIFDARFTNDKFLLVNGELEDLLINGAAYPVRITIEGTEIRIRDKIDGTLVNAELKDGDEIIITNELLKQFEISLVGIPTAYELYQNYPNPFNPNTRIKFALPSPAKVKLAIYNLLGQELNKILDDYMDAGYHEIEFNASNMSSGVYFYRIETEEYSSVRKMMLLK